MRKLLLVAIAGGVALTLPALAQTYNLTVAGYSPGGLVSTIGVGMDKALNKSYPGSTLTYQTSSGGLANAMLVSQGKVPLGFISDMEALVFKEGRKPFKEPITNLRMLFKPYVGAYRFQATHVLANKEWAEENGIKTFADIAEKKPKMRVAVNRPGNLDGDASITGFEAIGVTLDDIEKWGGQVVRAASKEMTSLILDRRLDLVSFGISYNHPRVREIANGIDVVMLPMTEKTANTIAEKMGTQPCMFKAEEYKFLASDSYSACVGLGTFVRADMDDQVAYDVTKAIFENVDVFKSAHRLLEKTVTLEHLAEPGVVPFHPGAAKYLKEKGLLKN